MNKNEHRAYMRIFISVMLICIAIMVGTQICLCREIEAIVGQLETIDEQLQNCIEALEQTNTEKSLKPQQGVILCVPGREDIVVEYDEDRYEIKPEKCSSSEGWGAASYTVWFEKR